MEERKTIVEIAKESGVSIATVSRVLNGNTRVLPETRKRIEEVIKKYKYTPNALARGLISKQSMTIGVIMPDISNPYFSKMFSEIELAAYKANYSTFLCNTLFRSVSRTAVEQLKEENYFEMMIQQKVDGVLIAGGQIDLIDISDSYIEALTRLANQIPLVVIGRQLEQVNCSFIDRENSSGISIVIHYFVSLGHKRIAFVGGEAGVHITESRLKVYKDTLKSLGYPIIEELISLSDYYVEDGYEAAKKLLENRIPFTAIIAMNDNVAFGAIRALADHHLSVPNDVAIISCDQFLSSDYYIPRLTGLNQHNEQFCRFITQILLSSIKGVHEPVKITLHPELVIRESCGTHLGFRNL